MKKILAMCLIVAMCLSFVACNNEPAKDDNVESETLEILNSVYDHCSFGIEYMLRAWEFSIQHGSDNTREEYEALFELFRVRMIMTDDTIVEALMNVYGYTLDNLSLGKDASRGLNKTVIGMLFMKADNSVPVARYEFKRKTANRDVNAEIEQIKENLKKIDNESETYQLFKEYYLMVVEMLEWIESPSGNYSTTSSNLLDYEKRYNSFNRELDLIIG